MKKIILLTTQHFNDKNEKNYFWNEFKNENHSIEFWGIYNCIYTNKIDNQNNKDIFYFNSIKDVKVKLSKLENDSIYFFIYFPINLKTYSLFKLVSLKAKQIIKLDYNHSLSNFTEQNNSLIDKIVYFSSAKKMVNLFLYKIVQHLIKKNTKKIQLFLTGNSIGFDYSLTFDDYFSYIETQNQEPILNYNYILFLDIYLPHHIDFVTHKIKTIDPTIYYKKLNSFFDILEKQLNMPVVIAAHPKSNYKNEFLNRKCIINETPNLVKNSFLVLNHYSSSVSYAILSQKPIIYFYSEEFLIKNTFLFKIYKRILFQSNYFKTLAINIDESIEIPIPVIDKQRYKEFVSNYILSQQYPLTNFQIVSKQLI